MLLIHAMPNYSAFSALTYLILPPLCSMSDTRLGSTIRNQCILRALDNKIGHPSYLTKLFDQLRETATMLTLFSGGPKNDLTPQPRQAGLYRMVNSTYAINSGLAFGLAILRSWSYALASVEGPIAWGVASIRCPPRKY